MKIRFKYEQILTLLDLDADGFEILSSYWEKWNEMKWMFLWNLKARVGFEPASSDSASTIAPGPPPHSTVASKFIQIVVHC